MHDVPNNTGFATYCDEYIFLATIYWVSPDKDIKFVMTFKA